MRIIGSLREPVEEGAALFLVDGDIARILGEVDRRLPWKRRDAVKILLSSPLSKCNIAKCCWQHYYYDHMDYSSHQLHCYMYVCVSVCVIFCTRVEENEVVLNFQKLQGDEELRMLDI